MTDEQLLTRFAATREEPAFESLVRRHGPMVLLVCRRVLGNVADAEDAFQATFILLAQKAGLIEQPNLLAGWLHGVANRIALRARSQCHRRQARERPIDAATIEGSAAAAADDPVWRDLRPVLDEEVGQLPQEYRTPVILCYLEGMTNQEAARQLGCPMGTIASRLARGRDLLRSRLARRGLMLSAGALATALTQNAATAASLPTAALAVQAGVLAATGQTAGVAALAPQAAALAGAGSLTSGMAPSLLWSKVKLWGALSAVMAATAGIIVVAVLPGDGDPGLLQGHSKSVQAVVFSPDGRTLASGSEDGLVCLWDATTGRRLHQLGGHDRGVLQLAFSSNGRLLAAASRDGAMKVWDVATGKERTGFRMPLGLDGADFVEALTFSSDDGWLIAGTWKGTIRVWDLGGGREVFAAGRENDMIGLHGLTLSADGQTLIGLIHGGGSIRRWDLARGSFADDPRGLEHEFPGTFSPDGTVVTSTVPARVGVGQGGNIVQLWDLATLKKGRTLVGHANKITRMAFSADGRTLATYDSQGHIKVWDVAGGKERVAVDKPVSPVRSLALSPDGQRLALGCMDHNVRQLNLSSPGK